LILAPDADFVGIEAAIQDLFNVLRMTKTQKVIEQHNELEQKVLHTIKLTTFFG
jgi:hypothetical protein